MSAETPRDWNDSVGWDKYWAEILTQRQEYDLVQDVGYLRFEEVWRVRGVKNILFVGNGISQAPKFFAYRGFNAVALDLSPLATNYACDYQFEYSEFYRMFNDRYFHINKKVWLDYCETANKVTFITGSLFDETLVPGPFELIISSRTLQGFAQDKQRLHQAIQCLNSRLASSGCLCNFVLNSTLAREMISLELESLGYVGRDYLNDPSKRIAWNWFGSG